MIQESTTTNNKKEMKRTWPFLLGLLLLAAPAAQAQFTYTTNNGTITITGYTGPGGAVTNPSAINGLAVTIVGVREHAANLLALGMGKRSTLGSPLQRLAAHYIPSAASTHQAPVFFPFAESLAYHGQEDPISLSALKLRLCPLTNPEEKS
jgi:hypothetical protein